MDKSLKDHTLLQAICRTNRLFLSKSFGRVVDYFSVFDSTAQALASDEESVKKVISNLLELCDILPAQLEKCLAHFAGVDRRIEGFEGLYAAQDCIATDDRRDAFAGDYSVLARLWEALSPIDMLLPFEAEYKWLTQIYLLVKPPPNDNHPFGRH